LPEQQEVEEMFDLNSYLSIPKKSNYITPSMNEIEEEEGKMSVIL
jgi:hypothetical protein